MSSLRAIWSASTRNPRTVDQEPQDIGQQRLCVGVLGHTPFALEDQPVIARDPDSDVSGLAGPEDEPAEEIRRLGAHQAILIIVRQRYVEPD